MSDKQRLGPAFVLAHRARQLEPLAALPALAHLAQAQHDLVVLRGPGQEHLGPVVRVQVAHVQVDQGQVRARCPGARRLVWVVLPAVALVDQVVAPVDPLAQGASAAAVAPGQVPVVVAAAAVPQAHSVGPATVVQSAAANLKSSAGKSLIRWMRPPSAASRCPAAMARLSGCPAALH